jgi:hypothetical protein
MTGLRNQRRSRTALTTHVTIVATRYSFGTHDAIDAERVGLH